MLVVIATRSGVKVVKVQMSEFSAKLLLEPSNFSTSIVQCVAWDGMAES